MPLIRTGLLFVPELAVTASDAIRSLLHRNIEGLVVVQETGVRDQRNWVEDVLRRWCDEEELDLIITSGGTLPAPGPSGREIVPDATAAILERSLPGLPEAMRAFAAEETELALLDRSIAGIRGRSLILNLPWGAGPAQLFLAAVVDLIEPILAHLQELSSAPRLDELLDKGAHDETDEGGSADGAGHTQAAITGGSRLDAAEFAAFLRRKTTNPGSPDVAG